jgi:PAS domain S-box-containing protein
MRALVPLGFVLLLAALLANSWAGYNNTRVLADVGERVNHTYRVLDLLDDVLANMLDAEAGQQGFLLTGQDDYLGPFEEALTRADEQVANLESQVSDNAEQQGRARRLAGLVDERRRLLREGVRLRRREGLEAAARFLAAGEGKRVMGRLRELVTAMRREEEELLRRREEQARDSARWAVVSSAVGAVLSVGLLGLSWLLAHRDSRRRQAAADDYRRQQEWLQVTLLGIGDGVIAADRAGAVNFLNPIAEQLTGWTPQAARGRPVAEVFRLSDEGSGAPLQDPVRRVLREGVVANLAGRAVLTARDGTTRPIEASGGTIRTPDGRVAGVVLVFRDAAERRRLERERAEALEHERQALADAARRKDEFLALLAHELRNPLGPVRNAARALRRRPDPDTLARAGELIERQTAHLARLVDDLLDAARISRGKVRIRAARLDLAGLVNRVADEYRPVLEQAGLTLTAAADGPLWVRGDPDRLAQVVGNLLHNAGKFTPPGGRIDVRLGRHGDEAVLTVRDTGPGVPPEMLPRLFDMYSQGGGTERGSGGLGLGLAMVKGLVELHGGRVRADSPEGGGAVFTVRLPLERTPTTSQMPAVDVTPAPAPRRVLLIEDNADAAASLTMLLEMAGHRIEVADNGTEGVARARAFRPDVVLCDLGLPGLSGYDVARALRADPATARACLVALTGHGHAEDRRRSRAAGFDEHLVKPVDPGELEQLLAAPPGGAVGSAR